VIAVAEFQNGRCGFAESKPPLWIEEEHATRAAIPFQTCFRREPGACHDG
jgi:hypothetical protein